MIKFDFDYYRPSTLEEAYSLFQALTTDGKTVIYYAGGTEIVTAFRKGTVKADAVIDLKGITGMQEIEQDDGYVIGACSDLNNVADQCPALASILETIADHTTRNAITIGGNICGRLPYKEAVLPLLALDAKVVIYGPHGLQEQDLRTVFDKRIKLSAGEFLYQIKVKTDQPVASRRFEASVNIDYPLTHLVVSKAGDGCFVGVSGLSAGPIHHLFDTRNRAVVLKHFEPLARTNMKGSADYKLALLDDALENLLKTLEVTHD